MKFACKHNCGGEYGHNWNCPSLSVFEVALADARERGDRFMWWNFEIVDVATGVRL